MFVAFPPIQNIISEGTSSSAIDLRMPFPSRLPDNIVMVEFFCTDCFDCQMQGKVKDANCRVDEIRLLGDRQRNGTWAVRLLEEFVDCHGFHRELTIGTS
jgi:hypothetical protein